MYQSFYGLRERPFDLTPNPRFLFLSAGQREVLSNLQYGLTTPRGLTLLLGEAGTGKTTLLQVALQGLASAGVTAVRISNPTLTRGEFYESLAEAFGLSTAAGKSKAQFLSELRRLVFQRFSIGRLSAVIFDEAQSLTDDLLEEVRLLSNMETPTAKLVNVVLAGQPELADRLNQPGLRQLKQRISLRCGLQPLNVRETAAYIAGRLRIAGGEPAGVFSRAAVGAIYQGTAGVPRTVNVVCDNALIGGFAAQVKPVSAGIVEEVLRDFDLPTGSALTAPRRHGLLEIEHEEGNLGPFLSVAAASGPGSARPGSMFEMFNRKRRFSFLKRDRG